jgi:transposase
VIDYKRILQLRAEDVSQRAIAEALRCSRNTVASVLMAATEQGLGFLEVAPLDNSEIRHLLFPELEESRSNRVQPDYTYIHNELARPNVTLLILWNEYANRCRQADETPYQYSFFCEQYRRWAHKTKATMRIPRKPGEIIEVDWAGDTMEFSDPLTGEAQTAYLFVAALTYSAYSYVEAFSKMDLDAWITAHIHAFEYFGGTARLLVPDNLRTGVKKADRYEPALNSTYAALSEHYSTVIIPARVTRPKDKPVVEGSVAHIANTIAAILRNRHFIGIYELNDAIAEELELLNSKPFQKRDDNRVVVFKRKELPLLNPLPDMPFEISELKKCKVAPNYHVQINRCFYSVPHRLIGKTLDVRVTARTVEVFLGTERVCTHPRIFHEKGGYATLEEHMPEGHRNYLRDWSPERFKNWASQVGPNTEEAVTKILTSKKIVEQGYRSCFGVLSLAKKEGGKKRLEDASFRALEMMSTPSYTLIKRLWSDYKESLAKPERSLGDKGFVRGSAYFSKQAGEGDDR